MLFAPSYIKQTNRYLFFLCVFFCVCVFFFVVLFYIKILKLSFFYDLIIIQILIIMIFITMIMGQLCDYCPNAYRTALSHYIIRIHLSGHLHVAR